MPFIRSISGLRATLGDCLTSQIVSQYSAAFSELLPEGSIVVCRDGRPSGKWIEQIISNTLISCGRKVKLLNIAPTPTIQLFVEKSDSIGGIAITASHNPSDWNGMKFISADGTFL
ncbi:MAG: phosphoglucosamine mutase, partial [Bacteroidota bacterium]